MFSKQSHGRYINLQSKARGYVLMTCLPQVGRCPSHLYSCMKRSHGYYEKVTRLKQGELDIYHSSNTFRLSLPSRPFCMIGSALSFVTYTLNVIISFHCPKVVCRPANWRSLKKFISGFTSLINLIRPQQILYKLFEG